MKLSDKKAMSYYNVINRSTGIMIGGYTTLNRKVLKALYCKERFILLTRKTK